MRAHLGCFLFWLGVCATPATALESLYVGARAGHVGLTSSAKATHGSALGYGLDVGFQTNPFLDLLFQFHQSRHDAGLKISSFFISADLNLVRFGVFDFFLSIGPGLYFFNINADKTTKFGIHGGFGGDLWLTRNFRFGVSARWHGVFSETAADNFWTMMLRMGYRFKL